MTQVRRTRAAAGQLAAALSAVRHAGTAGITCYQLSLQVHEDPEPAAKEGRDDDGGLFAAPPASSKPVSCTRALQLLAALEREGEIRCEKGPPGSAQIWRWFATR